MLRALREGTKKGFLLKFIMLGFLFMGLGGLVFMDIGSYFRGGLGSTTVARVGNKDISIYKFQNDAQRIIRAQNMTMEDAHRLGFINMILNATIAGELINQAAQDLNIEISKHKAEETIARVLDSYKVEDMSRKDKLKALLSNQNMSEDMLVAQTESQLKSALIKNALTSVSMLIPDETAIAFKTYQNEYRSIKSFVFTPNMAHFDTKPADEDIQKHYEMTKNQYLVPEKRDVSVIIIKPELFADNIKISDDDIKKVYEEHKDIYKLPERRYLKQAVVEDAATAQKILDMTKNGIALEQAVKRITGNDKAFRKETYFEKEGLLDSLADPVFSMEKPGIMPETHQSALGYHVVELTKIEAPRQQSLDDVKDSIKTELTQEQTDDSLMNMLDHADELLAAGDDINQMAEGLGLKAIKLKDLSQAPDALNQAFMPYGIYDTESIAAAIFELDENTVSDSVELDNDGFLYAETTAITPQAYKPLDEVKQNVIANWTQLKKDQAVLGKVAETTININTKDDVTFDGEAKALGAKITSFAKLTRNSDIPKGMTSDLLAAAFRLSPIGNVSYVKNEDTGSYYIYYVDEIGYPKDVMDDKEPLAVQKLQIVHPLESVVQELYQAHLFATKDVQINQDLLDYAFGGGSSAQN